MTRPTDKLRPPLLTQTKFNDHMDVLVYALVTAAMYDMAADAMNREANEAMTWDDAIPFQQVAVEHKRIADRYRGQALHYLDTLYGIGPEHMPLLYAFAQATAGPWHEVGVTIAELAKEIGRQEGLTEEHAERRVVFTKLRWR